MPLLDIQDLSIAFLRDDGYHEVVHHLSYRLERGRTLGIVGESGSGKSVSSLAVMGLLSRKRTLVTGRILFHDENLLDYSEEQMRAVRGARISMIFQEPMTALNPVQRCGDQVAEMLMLHEKVSRTEARQRVLALFQEVMLPRPEKIYSSYPHEISGGQKQRVVIAMALICNPDIIIADEPTTALDVTIQKTILQLLKQLQQQRGISIIFITHDLGVTAQIADDVVVMYKGAIVESGPTATVLYHPSQPYTKGLLACRPPMDSRPRHLPTVSDFLEGRGEVIAEERPLRAYPPQETPLLSVRNLTVTYTLSRNFFGRPTQQFNGVDGISFDIFKGETLGLVGESGCGKTTLGRAIIQLLRTSSGNVVYDGRQLCCLSSRELKVLRPKLQIVFQDPYSSLNPRLTVFQAIVEPLRVHRLCVSPEESQKRVLELCSRVGIEEDWLHRYPHEFSGGQRQRICIARALITMPELVICDESVSALDVSVQAQVLNLLNELKDYYGFTYLFITHDLSVVKFISDRIMVMRQGRLVEIGPTDSLYANPQQEYTQHLIDAIPTI